MPTRCFANFRHDHKKQRGAALLIMLIIMVIGAITIFVGSINSSALQIKRDKVTADALVKAKEALIGRAVADSNSPGSLPCPDNNNNGTADLFSGNNCPSYIGRLPWKTLGLPDDLVDSSGERLWYALSPIFRDYVSVNPINSNSQGTLTVSGSIPASNVVAIIFSPGSALNGQSRSSTNTIACTTSGANVAENLCAANYLEGSNANLNTATAPNLNYQTMAASSTFNDRQLLIMASDLIPLVEARVAKELLNSFANYLTANGNKYPYPANFNTCTSFNCPSDTTQCIGKIPATDIAAYLPSWFNPNRWFDVVYYAAGTTSLAPGGGGGGYRGWGRHGRGSSGFSGGSGSGSGSGSTSCTTASAYLTIGANTTINALILLPGTPLGATRTSISSANLNNYFEDQPDNTNLDSIYVIPGTVAFNSNDSIFSLP